MKRIAIFLAALMLSSAAFGQKVDNYNIPLNSINIEAADGVGEGAMAVFVVALAQSARAIFHQNSNEETVGWIPFISAGYERHIADTRWSLGGEVGYWHFGIRNKETQVINHTHIGTIAATSKIFYKPGGICKLYGGLNLGVGGISSSDGQVFPAIQFNPIGMRLGSEKAAFVLELGLGYRGIIQAGVTFGL